MGVISRQSKHQGGFSLGEMLISLLLASLIISLLMQHYLKTKQQYLHGQHLLENAFELQLALELIRDSVQRAGFTPCLTVNLLRTLDHRNNKRNLAALEFNHKKTPSVHIKRMSEHFSAVIKWLDPSTLLVTANKKKFFRGQAVFIADCYHGEVQQIFSREKLGKNWRIKFQKPLSFSYDERDTYVGEWLEETFFVQKNSQQQLALFYQLDHPEELTPLINKMTITKSIDQQTIFLNLLLGTEEEEKLLQIMVRPG